MSRRTRERQRAKSHSNRIQREPREPNRRTWPIVGAYVPVPDAWKVSGCGTAGIARRQPDGGLTYSIFNIELTKGGLVGAFGAENKQEEEVAEELQDFASLMPPFEKGEADVAARYVWGAYAMSLADDAVWASELISRHLGLLPTIGGTKNWWLNQFVLEMMPPQLFVTATTALDVPGIPQHKELAVAVSMEFELSDTQALLAAVAARPDDFRRTTDFEGDVNFEWILERKYAPGERVAHGLIGISPGKVFGHSPSLSMASRLVMELRKLSGVAIALRRVDWEDPSQLKLMPPGMMAID